jgi:hypothetical protein
MAIFLSSFRNLPPYWLTYKNANILIMLLRNSVIKTGSKPLSVITSASIFCNRNFDEQRGPLVWSIREPRNPAKQPRFFNPIKSTRKIKKISIDYRTCSVYPPGITGKPGAGLEDKLTRGQKNNELSVLLRNNPVFVSVRTHSLHWKFPCFFWRNSSF